MITSTQEGGITYYTVEKRGVRYTTYYSPKIGKWWIGATRLALRNSTGSGQWVNSIEDVSTSLSRPSNALQIVEPAKPVHHSLKAEQDALAEGKKFCGACAHGCQSCYVEENSPPILGDTNFQDESGQ